MGINGSVQANVVVQHENYPNCAISSSFVQFRRVNAIKDKLLKLRPWLKITHECGSGFLNNSFVFVHDNPVDNFIAAYFSKHNAKLCLARASEETDKKALRKEINSWKCDMKKAAENICIYLFYKILESKFSIFCSNNLVIRRIQFAYPTTAISYGDDFNALVVPENASENLVPTERPNSC